MAKILMLLLALGGALKADEEGDFKPEDALYAPEGESATAETSPSYYSSAKVIAFDSSRPAEALKDVEIFLDGAFVGKTPLELSGVLVNKPSFALTARVNGYEEAVRPAVQIPAQGELRVAMAGDNAASWYTAPSFVIGLGLIAGAVVAYSQNNGSSSSVGASLVGSGLGLIGLSQAVARLFHLPALRRQAEDYNRKHEAAP
jgi:hypothetical protein